MLTIDAEYLLIKSKYAKLNEVDIARYIGFNDEEIDMLDIFWESADTFGLIYLSDEFILNYLTNKTGKSAVKNYIKNKLLKQLTPDSYKLLENDHRLVKAYYDTADVAMPTNKQHYAVDRGNLEVLLFMSGTKKGLKTYRYYIKVERISWLLLRYNELLYEYEAKQRAAKKKEELLANEESALKAKEEALHNAEERVRAQDEISQLVDHILHNKEKRLNAREEALNARELAFNAREGALNARELAFNAREGALNDREGAFNAKEEALNDREGH